MPPQPRPYTPGHLQGGLDGSRVGTNGVHCCFRCCNLSLQHSTASTPHVKEQCSLVVVWRGTRCRCAAEQVAPPDELGGSRRRPRRPSALLPLWQRLLLLPLLWPLCLRCLRLRWLAHAGRWQRPRPICRQRRSRRSRRWVSRRLLLLRLLPGRQGWRAGRCSRAQRCCLLLHLPNPLRPVPGRRRGPLPLLLGQCRCWRQRWSSCVGRLLHLPHCHGLPLHGSQGIEIQLLILVAPVRHRGRRWREPLAAERRLAEAATPLWIARPASRALPSPPRLSQAPLMRAGAAAPAAQRVKAPPV